MRYILTFRTDFEESTEYMHPKGYSIIKLLEKKLIESGLVINLLDNYRDMAWSIDCQVNSKKLFFFVGYLGTKRTEWQLIVSSGVYFYKRLFGYNDDKECFMLATMVYNILSQDNRFFDLKWFLKYTDSSNDVWYQKPVYKYENNQK